VAEVANLDESETRTFEHGTVQTAKVGSLTVTRGTMQPGWRWSSDVKPIVGTDSCMVHHTGVALGPGDAHDIPPGHDAWVVGDEPYIGIDFSAEMAGFAKPS
jgi:hypothetical protein